jgi:hypothetical protein
LFKNIALLSLYFLRFFFGVHLYLVQYSVLMYCQHTSFAHKIMSNGPRTEPWGTPYLTGRLLDEYSVSWLFATCVTCCVLLVRWDLISLCGIPQTPYWYNLSIRMLCLIQSNAFDKSNSTQFHFVALFRFSIIFLIIVATASLWIYFS